MTLKEQLERDEGRVLHAYQDHLGYWTIGVGRLIDGRKGGGITNEECDYLLDNDINRITSALMVRWPWMLALDQARKECFVMMAFQLGVEGLAKFHATLALAQAGHYDQCAAQMLQSKWASQTPQRAYRVSEQMRTGKIV